MRAIILLIALIGMSTVRAGKRDVLFVLDGSTSVCGSTLTCANWRAALQLVYDIVNTWLIGTDDVQVALMTFGESTVIQWSLDGYTDKDLLLNAILRVPFPGGVMSTVGTVGFAAQLVFSNTYPDRLDAPNLVFMITDGEPLISSEQATASSAAFYAKGVTIFAIGVQTGCTEAYAQALASPPKTINETYFLANQYVGDAQHTGIESVRDSVLLAVNGP